MNAGVPPLYPEMKDGEIISAEYHDLTPPAAPVQEPVDSIQVSKVWWDDDKLVAKPIPFVEFYKAAPAAQRTWVGLDQEDKNEIVRMTERDDRSDVMRLVEAKLKEKNT